MKAVLISLMVQMTIFNFTYASEAPKAPVEKLNMGLEHMSLTTEEIKKRDELLRPIYDNYENVTLSSVANALEGAYGLNIYHHMIDNKDLNLKDKKHVMENAVRYFIGDESLFNEAADGVLGFKKSILIGRYDRYYGKNVFNDIEANLIEGNIKKFVERQQLSSPSILVSKIASIRIEDVIFGSKIGTRKALYSTVNDRLFTAPTMNDLLEAMKELNLKALDATVTFANGQIHVDNYQVKYKVVYPTFSKLAPIPQPAIFIAKDASYDDIVEMLIEHAPKIYAYNKLFNANLLPSVNDINSLLKRYPNIIKEVEKRVGNVKRENLINAVQSAFLNVTYGTGVLLAAPVALATMAASAAFSPIFVTTIIILL